MKSTGLVSATIPFIVCAFLFSACSRQYNSQAIYRDVLFDTVISVEILDPGRQDLIPEIQKLAEYYDSLFSKTNPSSDIVRINTSKGEPVRVSEETISLIQAGIKYSEISRGCFDITVGSVSSLWDFHAETPALPEDESILEGLKHISYKNIDISGDYIILKDPETCIDVGGIAKGFIADRLADFLRDKGVKHALINLGGNVLTMGGKPDGTDFRIGIQAPDKPDGTPITSVMVRDASVVTTGIYQRFFEIDGRIYHHVLDIRTGKPCDSDLSSVTIIAGSSLEADALSTICFLQGYDKARNFLKQYSDVQAVFITKDKQILYSSEDFGDSPEK